MGLCPTKVRALNPLLRVGLRSDCAELGGAGVRVGVESATALDPHGRLWGRLL